MSPEQPAIHVAGIVTFHHAFHVPAFRAGRDLAIDEPGKQRTDRAEVLPAHIADQAEQDHSSICDDQHRLPGRQTRSLAPGLTRCDQPSRRYGPMLGLVTLQVPAPAGKSRLCC
jgi:hypothetical protein